MFGHRGMSQYYPENTMLSFSKCAEDPRIDGVELDVHLCRSGEVVVAHDFSLKRTAGLDVEIEDMSLDELAAVDVCSFKGGQFSECRIPLLSDLFDKFGKRFIYDIELKVKAGHVNRELSLKVLRLIQKYGLGDNVVVSSFNPFALRTFCGVLRRSFRSMAIPTADIFEISKDIPKVLWNGKGRVVSSSVFQKPGLSRADDAFLKSHDRIPAICWTVNTRQDAERLLALNKDRMRVFGLIGNDPAMLCDVISHWNN